MTFAVYHPVNNAETKDILNFHSYSAAIGMSDSEIGPGGSSSVEATDGVTNSVGYNAYGTIGWNKNFYNDTWKSKPTTPRSLGISGCGGCAIDVCAPMVYNATMIFVETKLFTSRILDAMSDDEYAALQDHLSRHPDVGALIPGAGGVRKVRWAGSGRGKRGGSRLIYYWDCGDRILMLYVYLKNERENLTEGQKKMMKQIAEGYKHE